MAAQVTKKTARNATRPRALRVVREASAVYGGAIVLYRDDDGSVTLDVRLEQDTIWLSQKQMAELFATERSVITKHLRNIFRTGELDKRSNVRKMHLPHSDKPILFYNLDVAISVGYRVNSKRGTHFRIWATNVLHQHIVHGYSANVRRLKELRLSLQLAARVLDHCDLPAAHAREVLRVVTDYERALDILDDYDHQRLQQAPRAAQPAQGLSCNEARALVQQMRAKFGGATLFGAERDDSLQSSLNAIMQTFDGKDLYPSCEEKAACLLYFVVKNHSFIDGNKRIAAALFLRFLEKNHLLYRPDGSKRIADAALVAMTLMMAASRPEHKNALTRLVAHLVHTEP